MKPLEEKRIYWKKHQAAWEYSGLTQRDYCARENIAYGSFKKWRNRLRPKTAAQSPGFVEVCPVDSEKSGSNALILQISLSNGTRIAVSAQASTGVVEQVLKVAGGASCSA